MAEGHVMDADTGQAWLDEELSPAERARVEAHMAQCPLCQDALAEWLGVRACLADYELPAEAPGAAWRFWRELAPQLPERGAAPDRAHYLTPVALAAAYGLWQLVAAVIALLAGLARTGLVTPVWQQVAASGLVAALAQAVTARTWWGAGLSHLTPPSLPGPWPGWLGPVALAAVGWWVIAVLAGPFVAWLYLWLQRPHSASEAAAVLHHSRLDVNDGAA